MYVLVVKLFKEIIKIDGKQKVQRRKREKQNKKILVRKEQNIVIKLMSSIHKKRNTLNKYEDPLQKINRQQY